MGSRVGIGYMMGWLFCLLGWGSTEGMAQNCGISSTYVVQGSAQDAGANGYLLSRGDRPDQYAAVWNSQPIRLDKDFDFSFDVFLCGSADGICFLLQKQGTGFNPGAAYSGGALNYFQAPESAGSFGVELDIYQNTEPYNDPDNSHMALIGDGRPAPIGNAVSIRPRLANCEQRSLRIVWKASALLFQAYLDDTLRLQHVEDLIRNRFEGDTAVTFGFTGSTGTLTATQLVAPRTLLYNGSASVSIQASGPTLFCQPDTLTLTVASPVEGATYTWHIGDATDSVNAPSLRISPSQPTLYRLTARFANGCMMTDSIRAEGRPGVLIRATRPPAVCRGQLTPLEALGATPEIRCTWSPDIGFNRTAGPKVTLSPLLSSLYRVVAQSPSGCYSQDTFWVSVRQGPQVSLGSDRVLCPGGVATLAPKARLADSLDPSWHYRWLPAHALPATDARSVQVRPTEPTLYTVITRDTFGCSNPSSVRVTLTDTLRVDVRADLLPEGTRFAYTATPVDRVRHQYWDFGDGTAYDTTEAPLHHYAKPGAYSSRLQLSYTPGCRQTITAAALAPSLPNIITPNDDGLNDSFDPVVSLYPVDLYVYDRVGRQVFAQAAYTGGWAPALAGVYFYRLCDTRGKVWRGWVEAVRE